MSTSVRVGKDELTGVIIGKHARVNNGKHR